MSKYIYRFNRLFKSDVNSVCNSVIEEYDLEVLPLGFSSFITEVFTYLLQEMVALYYINGTCKDSYVNTIDSNYISDMMDALFIYDDDAYSNFMSTIILLAIDGNKFANELFKVCQPNGIELYDDFTDIKRYYEHNRDDTLTNLSLLSEQLVSNMLLKVDFSNIVDVNLRMGEYISDAEVSIPSRKVIIYVKKKD